MYQDELRYHVARERHTDLLTEATGTRQGRQACAPVARPAWRWAVTWRPVRFTLRLPVLRAGKPGGETWG